VFDAARMDDRIVKAKELCPDFLSLYRGEKEHQLASVAPYIFDVTNNSEMEDWFFNEGYGDSWGIMCFSLKNLKQIRNHLHYFLVVLTEDSKELLFRFYDPRALRIFLPSCNNREVEVFFGPIDYFVCEDDHPETGLIFSLVDGELTTNTVEKSDMKLFNPEVKKKKYWLF